MQKIIIIFALLSFAFMIGYANSSQNEIKKNKKIDQLTRGAKLTDLIESPDNQWIAFVKTSKKIIPSSCAFSLTTTNYADEIWMINVNTMQKKLLVAGNPDCDNPEKTIIDPNDLQFSPDSKTLYFATSAWATSGAIHAIDSDGKNLRFITAGNEYHVVTHGKYRGDLIVNQHRYHDQGGSYDWDWLFTPQGKQIKLYRKEY
ncbi:MAG: hypothetical protein A3F12_00905 [Gammaproteobacteria bacterium RIFCSPHIGHO2_12_FULL_38_14]|nr:MAG: hypothetical protein A3F12_00905 [Gammaproteobacteria bacterium RIFCSPHIGHO2_12_FULL_38_14]